MLLLRLDYKRAGPLLPFCPWLFLPSLWWNRLPCCDQLWVEAHVARNREQPPASGSVVSSFLQRPAWQGIDAFSQQSARAQGLPTAVGRSLELHLPLVELRDDCSFADTLIAASWKTLSQGIQLSCALVLDPQKLVIMKMLCSKPQSLGRIFMLQYIMGPVVLETKYHLKI